MTYVANKLTSLRADIPQLVAGASYSCMLHFQMLSGYLQNISSTISNQCTFILYTFGILDVDILVKSYIMFDFG
jgi:hypothetical protein